MVVQNDQTELKKTHVISWLGKELRNERNSLVMIDSFVVASTVEREAEALDVTNSL